MPGGQLPALAGFTQGHPAASQSSQTQLCGEAQMFDALGGIYALSPPELPGKSTNTADANHALQGLPLAQVEGKELGRANFSWTSGMD